MTRRVVVGLSVLLVVLAFAPLLEAGFFGTDLYVPSIGRKVGLGGTFWHTALWVHNPSGASVAVTVQYLPRNSSALPPGMSQTFTVPPGGTWQDSDAINTLFPGLSGYGALRITSTAEVLANCRMYNQPDGTLLKDTTGQDYAAIPSSFAIASGRATEVLGAFSDLSNPDPDFRTGFGYVEVAGFPANVRVKVFGPDGAQLGSWDDPNPLQPYENRYFTDMPVKFPAASGTNLRLQVEVIAGSGKVLAVGSLVSNGPSDGTTFEMAFADQLLGIQNVVHDATLTGNGTGASPLGIANGGVTAAKISASGATNGQVLASSGGVAVWQDPATLTLPYAGAVTTANAAFHATNGGATGAGVQGDAQSGAGVVGMSNGGYGVYGQSNSGLAAIYGYCPTGVAIFGRGHNGVYGLSADGPGVYGEADGSDAGVSGYGSIANSIGVKGDAPNGNGVVGTSNAVGYAAVYGKNPNGYGIYGEANRGSVDAAGVYGLNSNGTGVFGISTGGNGIEGHSTDGVGVAGQSSNSDGVSGVSAKAFGVQGQGSGNYAGVAGYNYGSAAGVYGGGSSGLAGYFDGNVHVNGTLSKTAGSFKIDHPLDPEHQYLYHSFVESPDMMNIYNGNVTTDATGDAIVELPAWFEALNRDFRYQLTVIGGGDVWAQARVARKIAANAFAIQTSAPNIEVSWQVTGIRKDPYANAHRIPVEEEKPAIEQGSYLHPDVYGQPEEKSVGWARNPEMMRRFKEERAAHEQPGPAK